jgi:hypothetical protein
MGWFSFFDDVDSVSDVIEGEVENYVGEKYVITDFFKNLIDKCACDGDEKDKSKFDSLYGKLVENKIIQQGSKFLFFNQSEHFVQNKYVELESLLEMLKLKKCTKNKVLEFYKSETGMIMNVVNNYGGRKTRRKKRLKSILVANSTFGDSHYFSGPYPKTIKFKKVIPSKN